MINVNINILMKGTALQKRKEIYLFGKMDNT